MTPDQQAIFEKLKSRKWRLGNLYWIEDERGQKVKFRPNAVQRLFLRDMWWLNVILKSRQHGMSTLVNLLQLDECLFNPNHTCGIIDKTDADAVKKMKKIRFAYEHLDDPDDPATAHLGAMIKREMPLATDNEHELTWSNDSKIWCGTSLRGGTVQFLHVSELGPIAYKDARKAEEIRAGSLNTVHSGSKIVIESTHEGGKAGLNYEMIQIAQRSATLPELTPMDWKFHFYAWWQDPKNVNPIPASGVSFTQKEIEYFDKLAEDHQIHLSAEQRHWYSKKLMTQKHAMFKEQPSTAAEAINAVVRGAIYGKIINELREQGRVKDFVHDQTAPVFTFWDLGQSDFTAIWAVQFSGPEFFILRHYANRGQGARHYAIQIREWERELGPIGAHFLPHDASNRVGPGKTWMDSLKEAGLDNIKVVPRTPDVWIGINHLRSLLPRCYIHESGCGEEREVDGRIIPSGIAALEGYHTKEEDSGGLIKEMPVHDQCSHSCFIGTTPILMGDGLTEKPISLIKPGDHVWTPFGERAVLRLWDNGVRETIRLGDLRLTPDHAVFSKGALTKCDELRTVAEVWSFKRKQKQSNITGLNTTGITTTLLPHRLRERLPVIYTVKSGLMRMAQYLINIMCITKTEILLTIPLRILSAFLSSSIFLNTQRRASGSDVEGQQRHCWKKRFLKQKNGIDQKREESGIQNMGKGHGRAESLLKRSAKSVDQSLNLLFRTMCFVAESVNRGTSLVQLLVQLSKRANAVDRSLKTRVGRIVPNTVLQGAKIVALEKTEERELHQVYDLKVEGVGCYVAGGVLVSNCDAIRTMAEAHNRGMIDGAAKIVREGRNRNITVHKAVPDERLRSIDVTKRRRRINVIR